MASLLGNTDLVRAPVAFASPNLLELEQMYRIAKTEPFEFTSHPGWWAIIDKFSLGSTFQADLQHLSKIKVSESATSTGTLSFLVDRGIAQMAMNLLPIFQHLVIKCGDNGVVVAFRVSGEEVQASGWFNERSNPRRRYIVVHGNSEIVILQHFPALDIHESSIINVTGAGDSLVGSILASLAKVPKAFDHPQALNDAIFDAQSAAVLSLKSQLAVSPLLSSAVPRLRQQ